MAGDASSTPSCNGLRDAFLHNAATMSFFDFFFPEQAQASHLRSIAESQRLNSHRDGQRQFREERERRNEASHGQATERRVEELENDLGQAGLIIESLLQLLEESGTIKRDEVMKRAIAVDLADGIQDGRLTPAGIANRAKPFIPHRKWDQASE